MILFKKVEDLSSFLNSCRQQQQSIGFVPTMGALHAGHLSLIDKCRAENKIVCCSIFVNPTQFNNVNDLEHYPNTIEQDIELLIKHQCDVLFLPERDEVYPSQFDFKKFDLGGLEHIWEGKFRPGHFQGVCQVVDRLLQIVNPSSLYLGQKDLQQCLVIDKLLSETGRRNIKLSIEPTIREADGLAMSSRNLRLSTKERQAANEIYKALLYVKTSAGDTPLSHRVEEARTHLANKGFRLDYLAVVDANDLTETDDRSKTLVAIVAAYSGEIRLIDNLFLN